MLTQSCPSVVQEKQSLFTISSHHSWNRHSAAVNKMLRPLLIIEFTNCVRGRLSTVRNANSQVPARANKPE